MKKILLSLSLLTVICFSVFSFFVKAEEKTALLSPAIEIIKESTFLSKGNICGSAVNFNEDDFSELCGSTRWDKIEITSLPESTVGILQLEGITVNEGVTVTKEKVNSLKVIPSGENTGKTEFRFRISSSDSEYKCVVTMGEYKEELPKPLSTVGRTYRNVAVFSEIEKVDEHFIKITSPCKNGILSMDHSSGTYIYQPSRNFVGTDEFQYCIYDEYGNRSEVSTVKIKIEKAKNNLFFYDLTNKAEHKTAIYVCSEGLLPYTTDENGLPIFCGDEVVDRKTFLNAVQKMLPNATVSDNSREYIGEAEAVHILSTAIASEFGKELEVMEVIEPNAISGTVLTRKRCAIFLEEIARHLATSYFVSEP